jgi:hypothetical protein
MSYQAQAFVRNIRGLSRGEKSLLMALAFYHDHRTGECRTSNQELANDTEMSERHVITLLQHIEARQILSRAREKDGRGSLTRFQFIGMPQKGELASPLEISERVKSATRKGEICAEKGELASPPNKERAVKASNTEIQTHPNPPFQESLTVRDRRHLNAEIYAIMQEQTIDFKTALEVACARLLIPVASAWELVGAAGLGDARKEPHKATA